MTTQDAIPPALAQKYMTRAEAMEALNVSKSTFYRLKRAKMLTTKLWYRKLMVSRASVQRVLNAALRGDL